MFSILDGVENFSEWISGGPVGWIFMNPLMLAVMITLIVVFLHEMYADDDDDRALTKFIVYTFLAVLIPLIVNNNAIDRKVAQGSYEVTAADMEWDGMKERGMYDGGRDMGRYDVSGAYSHQISRNDDYSRRY
jgi:hypothetical protein